MTTKRASNRHEFANNKRCRIVNDWLRPRTWYAVVLKGESLNNDLEAGLHWSAQPGCDKGCFYFHATVAEAAEHCRRIETDEHWHGDERNAFPLAMVEMKLSCSCQKRLTASGVMRLVKEVGGKQTMRWADLLRGAVKDDGWEAPIDKEDFQVKEVVWDGGMPTEMPMELEPMPVVERQGCFPEDGKLYGIILAEFQSRLTTTSGLHWGMPPGGWGSLTMHQKQSACKKKYDGYQALARGLDRQPALCILTVWVKSQRAWKFLEDQDVLLSKNGRHYLKKPVHEYEYFIDERGNRDLCYMATVKGIFPEAN